MPFCFSLNYFVEMNIVGFKPPLIHCYNKSASVIPTDAPFLSEVSKKSNVLLLGDNIGDCDLWKGLVPNDSNIVKIGFFNRQVKCCVDFCNLFTQQKLYYITSSVPRTEKSKFSIFNRQIICIL